MDRLMRMTRSAGRVEERVWVLGDGRGIDYIHRPRWVHRYLFFSESASVMEEGQQSAELRSSMGLLYG